MKNKYIFGGFIIVIFLGLMAYLFTQTNIKYEEDFSEIIKSTKTIKATGQWVKNKSYKIDKEKKLFSFFIHDFNGKELMVVYKGTIPNNFESSTSIVVTGKYKDGIFHASEILTKCPSKYESQFQSESTT
ncbi:cytochrome c maturation protein CcmE [Bacteroidota bacterium]